MFPDGVYPTVFKLGSSSLRMMLTYPGTKNSWNRFFYSGPGFWAVAPNVPKMAQNTKIVTHPTVFELGSSSPRIMLTYPRVKNLWTRFFIRVPVFGLWP